MRTWRLECELLLPGLRRGDVFPSFADAFNLERLVSPSTQVRVLTPPPIELRRTFEHRSRGLAAHFGTPPAAGALHLRAEQ